jgi:hypothetical protein
MTILTPAIRLITVLRLPAVRLVRPISVDPPEPAAPARRAA